MEKLLHKTPKLRFKNFSEPWVLRRLSEVLSEAKKRNTNLEYDKSQVLSVSGEFGIVNQIEHLGRSYAGESVHNYHIVEHGDIVYTKSPLKENPYGIIKLNKGIPGIVSTLYAVYKLNYKEINGDFLNYYFSLDANTNRYLRPLVKKGAKNDMKINNGYVLNDSIYFPQLQEQEKISSFISVIDTRIKQLTLKKVLLEKYKKGVTKKIFDQEIRFKKDDGSNFSEWGEKNLAAITKLITKGTTPDKFSLSGVNFIKIESFEGNKISLRKSLFIDNETHNRDLKRSILKERDILFAIAGATIGKCNIVCADVLPANTNQALAIIRLHENEVTDFIYQILISEFMQKYIRENVAVGAQPNINLQQLNNFSFLYPEHEEQLKISRFLASIDQQRDLINQQLEKSNAFRKGILQRIFI